MNINSLLDVVDSLNIFGLNIPLYGFVIAIGMILAVIVVGKICKYRDLVFDDILLLALYAIPIAIVGARLYYVIFSGDSYTFLQVFKIWEGGLAIYGGIIGGTVGAFLYCLIHKKNFLCVADVAVVGLILGQGIGRIGCYFAGCCYGIEVTNPASQWFPLATFEHGAWHYSTFFYESFFNLIGFVVLLLIARKNKTKGFILSLYLIIYGTVRCIIETFRGDSLYLFGSGIKVSQLLSALLIVGGIILMAIVQTRKKRANVIEDNNKTST